MRIQSDRDSGLRVKMHTEKGPEGYTPLSGHFRERK